MPFKRAAQRALAPVLVLFGASSVHRVDAQWILKAPMPTVRHGLATATESGKVYAIGGFTPGSGFVGTLAEYDPALDAWTTKAAMPTVRRYLCAAAVGGKVYAIGGEPGPTSVVEEYTPGTNTWIAVASMPTPRLGAAAVEIGGFIYVMGGWGGAYLSTVERYDPVANSWSPRASMPTARGYLAASAINGKAYAVGGGIGSGNLNVVEEYDPVLDTWSTKAPMPTSRSGLASTSVGNRIYAVGGNTGAADLATVEIYDILADAWFSGPNLSAARFGLASSAVAGNVYAIGGTDSFGTTYATTEELHLECLVPPLVGATCLPFLPQAGATGLCYNALITPNADTLSTTYAVTGFDWTATITKAVPSAPAGFSLSVKSLRIPLANGVAAPPPITGRVLISGPLLSILSGPHNGLTGTITATIPCSINLVGAHWAAQAVILGGGAKLSSAVEGTVGTF